MDEGETRLCPHCGASLRIGMIRCRECGRLAPRPTAEAKEEGDPKESPPRETAHSAAGVSNSLVAEAADGAAPDAPNGTAATIDASPQRPHAGSRFQRPRRAALMAVVAVLAIAATIAAGWRRSSEPRSAAWERERRVGESRIVAATFAPDGDSIFAATSDGHVVRWSAEEGALGWRSESCGAGILCLAMNAQGFLLTGTEEPALCGWENALGAKPVFQKQAGLFAPISSIAVHPQRSEFVLGLINNDLLFFGNRAPLRHESGHQGGVRVTLYSPDGRTLVTGGADGSIVWRNSETGERQAPPMQLAAEIGAIAYSSDGTRLAAGDWNGNAVVLDSSTRKPLAEFRQPDAVSGIAIVGTNLVTTSWDGWIRVWSIRDRSVSQMHRAGEPMTSFSLDPKGRRAATVLQNGRLWIWRLPGLLGH